MRQSTRSVQPAGRQRRSAARECRFVQVDALEDELNFVNQTLRELNDVPTRASPVRRTMLYTDKDFGSSGVPVSRQRGGLAEDFTRRVRDTMCLFSLCHSL